MDKMLNHITIAFTFIGILCVDILGGADGLLGTLLFFVTIDYLTGICKGIVTKQISSKIGFLGIFKKILIFITVAMAVSLESLANHAIPLRDITILFYISNEGISLLENTAEFLPIPQKVKDTLLQLRSPSD